MSWIDLAEHQTDAFISLKDIAGRQDISDKYLERIIRMLVKVLKSPRRAAINKLFLFFKSPLCHRK